MIFTLLYHSNKICRRNSLRKFSTKSYRFLLFAFPFRYFMEQFFKLFITLMVETLNISGHSKRNLTYSPIYKIALGFSFFAFLLLSLILVSSVIKGARNTKRTSNDKFLVVSNGLKQESPKFVLMHYGHFFLIRVSITLLIFLTPFVDSKLLWIIMCLI